MGKNIFNQYLLCIAVLSFFLERKKANCAVSWSKLFDVVQSELPSNFCRCGLYINCMKIIHLKTNVRTKSLRPFLYRLHSWLTSLMDNYIHLAGNTLLQLCIASRTENYSMHAQHNIFTLVSNKNTIVEDPYYDVYLLYSI